MTQFEYSNLSARPSGPVLRTLGYVLPGVRRVQADVPAFAAAWRAANLAAVQQTGPLWVALGDSMTQGIGARTIAGSWVAQLQDELPERYRVVNLAVSGARAQDVLDRQLPALATLGSEPALVTVLIGSNDMLRRSYRDALPATFAALLARLPAHSVVATLPRGNPAALAVNTLLDDAARAGRITLADTRGRDLSSWRGKLAADHFHPNELGYASIAATFARAIATATTPGRPTDGR